MQLCCIFLLLFAQQAELHGERGRHEKSRRDRGAKPGGQRQANPGQGAEDDAEHRNLIGLEPEPDQRERGYCAAMSTTAGGGLDGAELRAVSAAVLAVTSRRSVPAPPHMCGF